MNINNLSETVYKKNVQIKVKLIHMYAKKSLNIRLAKLKRFSFT